MLVKLLAHLRAQWMGALALFLVLTGGAAYAANTVFSSDIVNGEVKSADIGNNEVQSGDIGNGQVGIADLGNNSVGSPELVDSSVKTAELDTGAVQSADVLDNGLASADVADNGLSGDDVDESTLNLDSHFASAKAGVGGITCTADAGPQECAATQIDLPRPSKLLIVASGQWWTASFNVSPADDPDQATATCEIQVDDVSTDSSNAMGERRTVAGAQPWTQFPFAGFARGTLALTHLTDTLAAGAHEIDVTCAEVDPDVDWANVRLVAARVG
jgi:hypothetical protein